MGYFDVFLVYGVQLEVYGVASERTSVADEGQQVCEAADEMYHQPTMQLKQLQDLHPHRLQP